MYDYLSWPTAVHRPVYWDPESSILRARGQRQAHPANMSCIAAVIGRWVFMSVVYVRGVSGAAGSGQLGQHGRQVFAGGSAVRRRQLPHSRRHQRARLVVMVAVQRRAQQLTDATHRRLRQLR